MFENIDWIGAIMRLIVFIPAITLHEFCHAKFADLAGDMTPRSQGRVTLNPLAHLDPMGSLMIVLSGALGAGIGWGKPVMVNVGKMKNPRWDHFISVIMGPVSNLFQAIVFAMIIRLGLASYDESIIFDTKLALSSGQNMWTYFVGMSLIANTAMFFFNMIPIGPLDGHWLIGSMMKPQARNAWYKFCHGPGMIIFIVLVLIPSSSKYDVLGMFLRSTIYPTVDFLLGLKSR